jgi:hypothetical protein
MVAVAEDVGTPLLQFSETFQSPDEGLVQLVIWACDFLTRIAGDNNMARKQKRSRGELFTMRGFVGGNFLDDKYFLPARFLHIALVVMSFQTFCNKS